MFICPPPSVECCRDDSSGLQKWQIHVSFDRLDAACRQKLRFVSVSRLSSLTVVLTLEWKARFLPMIATLLRAYLMRSLYRLRSRRGSVVLRRKSVMEAPVSHIRDVEALSMCP